MSYIGKTPTVGNFIKLDAITTSATNSYTLQHNSVNFSPESANHMLVSLNGVIQAPNTAFSVSGSTITFLPSSGTLSSSDSIDFIMVYGNVLDVGVASSVADASITKGKMNLISDSSSAGLTIKGDGGSENGTLQLNCSQNSHGIKLSSPAHSSGQSYELIFPTGNVTADKVLKVASVSGSGTTGVGQLSFGDAGGSNTPMFDARANASQTISNNTNTKIVFGLENVDSDNCFASSRFTPTTAGWYVFHGSTGGTAKSGYIAVWIKKNGSEDHYLVDSSSHSSSYMEQGTKVLYMNGSGDYVELYINMSDGRTLSYSNNNAATRFAGYKLIT